MKVRDMMHKGVACVSPDTAIDAVAKKMRELDVGAIPVAANGNLVGMITDRTSLSAVSPATKPCRRSRPRT